jgi:hypothetical protein
MLRCLLKLCEFKIQKAPSEIVLIIKPEIHNVKVFISHFFIGSENFECSVRKTMHYLGENQ